MSMLMNEGHGAVPTMLPFENHHTPAMLSNLYESPQTQSPKRLIPLKFPRVVRNQKAKFETDELFRKLARETEVVRYTGYRDRDPTERRRHFLNQCKEGWTEIAFTNSGTNLQLSFSTQGGFSNVEGKVRIKSHLIMNGVCVRCIGEIDIERLEGTGYLEFDEESASIEDKLFNTQYEEWQQKLREFMEKRPFKPFQPPGTNIKVE